MTTLGKLFRTTAFKLALAYSIVFALAAGGVFAGIGWNVRNVIDDQIGDTIDADIRGLADQYAQGGIHQVSQSIERRLQRPGDDVYLLTTFAGDPVVGNIGTLPNVTFPENALAETTYQRTGEKTIKHRALVRAFVLPGGFKLIVGHDIEERERIESVFKSALSTALVWLVVIGVAGGLFMARRVLMRVDGMADSALAIMTGDRTKRLPTNGSGDELDRLADNLNVMLGRIAELMVGLQAVSDNIAHDLRTPLTRLRNRAEAALRESDDPHALRTSLEKVIEESDGMIRIFDALLMIARAEAGTIGSLGRIDAAAVMADVGELYEAVADEDGVTLRVDTQPDLWIDGSRELVGQALANLVDNALKYGRSGTTSSRIAMSAVRSGDRVELSVADNGSGIPVEDRARVTQRFVRLETSRSRPGSGLGLSLAAAVAHLHGGEMRLEDNAPGLRVVLSIPAAVPPAMPKRQETPLLPAMQS